MAGSASGRTGRLGGEDRPQAAPFAVNQIAHSSNDQLEHDVDVCAEHEVCRSPSPRFLRAQIRRRQDARRGRRGVARRHQHPPAKEGGLGRRRWPHPRLRRRGRPCRHALALRAGARGARLVQGTILLSGSIADGRSIFAAQALGADFAYIGTRFHRDRGSQRGRGLQEVDRQSSAEDIVIPNLFTGVQWQLSRAVDRRRRPTRTTCRSPTSRR